MAILPDNLKSILEHPEILEASELENPSTEVELTLAFVTERKSVLSRLTEADKDAVFTKYQEVSRGMNQTMQSGYLGGKNKSYVRQVKRDRKCTFEAFKGMLLAIRTKEPNFEFPEFTAKQEIVDAHETDCRSYWRFFQAYVHADLMNVKLGFQCHLEFLRHEAKLTPADQQHLQQHRYRSSKQFSELTWEQFLVLLQAIEEGSLFNANNLREELISSQGINFGLPWRRRLKDGLQLRTSRFRASIYDGFPAVLRQEIKTAHIWLPPWVRAYCLSGLYASEMIQDPTIVSLLKAHE